MTEYETSRSVHFNKYRTGHAVCTEKQETHKFLAGKAGRHISLGRTRCGCENNNKMDLNERVCEGVH
jgi:ferredoxin-thioredoxin reductase catalytic subunit